jgi:hypothetical protein
MYSVGGVGRDYRRRTKVNAKDYLKQIRVIDNRIKDKETQKAELLEMMGSIKGMTYDGDIVQTSANGDQMVNLMIRIEEITNQILDDTRKYIDLKDKIIGQIQSIGDWRIESLLFKRYVEYKSFELIAIEMGFNYDYTRELHGAALACFEEVADN